MASSTDSSPAVDDEVRQLYERYQVAESDADRREIALEMGKLDGRRHAEIYAALEQLIEVGDNSITVSFSVRGFRVVVTPSTVAATKRESLEQI